MNSRSVKIKTENLGEVAPLDKMKQRRALAAVKILEDKPVRSTYHQSNDVTVHVCTEPKGQ